MLPHTLAKRNQSSIYPYHAATVLRASKMVSIELRPPTPMATVAIALAHPNRCSEAGTIKLNGGWVDRGTRLPKQTSFVDKCCRHTKPR
jgi:hypothetical protein